MDSKLQLFAKVLLKEHYDEFLEKEYDLDEKKRELLRRIYCE